MVSVLTMGTLGAVGAAYAKDKELRTNEAAIIANAKVHDGNRQSPPAEQKTGGKAVGTGIEDQDGTVFLEVQVLKDNQKHSVLIDPQSGPSRQGCDRRRGGRRLTLVRGDGRLTAQREPFRTKSMPRRLSAQEHKQFEHVASGRRGSNCGAQPLVQPAARVKRI